MYGRDARCGRDSLGDTHTPPPGSSIALHVKQCDAYVAALQAHGAPNSSPRPLHLLYLNVQFSAGWLQMASPCSTHASSQPACGTTAAAVGRCSCISGALWAGCRLKLTHSSKKCCTTTCPRPKPSRTLNQAGSDLAAALLLLAAIAPATAVLCGACSQHHRAAGAQHVTAAICLYIPEPGLSWGGVEMEEPSPRRLHEGCAGCINSRNQPTRVQIPAGSRIRLPADNIG